MHAFRLQSVRDVCSAQHIQLPWPAYSPYISPIEHAWDLVCQRLARDLRSVASKEELFLRIQAIWNSLPQADIQNLFDSMSNSSTFCSAWCLHEILISDT
ncbi:transposable element Tcb2 transposase [Trichonephila clavipes]|nr:transposable element Tcb2 transposase [Trichonephila clavipes]